MKDISSYVRELLFNHQCVIIPKFGAFISNRKSAQLLEDKSFAPPKRELTFNSSLISNDGLLIKHIAETEEVSYEVAENFVIQAVENWKERLQEKDTIILPGIGSLKLNIEGRTIFEASDDVNFLTDSFGMTPFVPHEVAKETTTTEGTANPTANAIPKPQIPTQKEPKKRKGFVKYVAIFIVGLAIATFGAYYFINIDNNSPVEVAIEESAVKQGVEQHLSEATFFNSQPVMLPLASISLTKIDEKTTSEEKDAKKETTDKNTTQKEVVKEKSNEVVENTKTTTNSKKYHLIAGAFKDKKNAQIRVKQLRKNGFPNASIVGRNAKGLFQVSYAGFDQAIEAEQLRQKIKETKNLDGWILTNE